jgi:hypothetical protein
MAGERKITYEDVMNLEKELLGAPELPKEGQDITGKKSHVRSQERDALVS